MLQLLVMKDMNIKTYEYFIKQPMQMVELNLKMIIINNPHPMNALDISINHPLPRKYSNALFN